MPHTDAIVVMTTLASTDEAVKLVRARHGVAQRAIII
jgi:hypothetical protein